MLLRSSHKTVPGRHEKEQRKQLRARLENEDARDVHEHSISAFLMVLSQSYILPSPAYGMARETFMCSYPQISFLFILESLRFRVFFLQPGLFFFSSGSREEISKEALFLVESSNYIALHTHTHKMHTHTMIR